MTNGQLIAVTAPTTMPLAAALTGSADVADGQQQNAGNFAGLLHGIQHSAKTKDSPDTSQTEQVQSQNGTVALTADASAGLPDGNMHTLLQALQNKNTSSVNAPTLSADLKAAEVKSGTDTKAGVPSDIVTLLALAGYAQPGRMPEVNIPAAGLQNEAAALTQATAGIPVATPLVIPAILQGQPTAAEQSDTVLKTAEKTIPATSSIIIPQNVRAVTGHPFDEQAVPFASLIENGRKTAEASVLPAESSAKTVPNQSSASERVTISIPSTAVATKPAQADVIPEAALKTADSNSAKALADSRQQDVISLADRLGVTAREVKDIKIENVAAEKLPEARMAEQLPVETTAKQVLEPEPTKAEKLPVATKVEQMVSAMPTAVKPEETVKAAEVAMTGLPSADTKEKSITPMALNTAAIDKPVNKPSEPVSPVISAPVPAVAVADNRPAGTAHAQVHLQQQNVLQPQNEVNRKDSSPAVAKELAQTLQTASATSESSLDSDNSQGGSDSHQQYAGTNSQILEQQMRGQLGAEHQNSAALTPKAVPAEPVRQEVSNQILQQVKDNLGQHDVKQGNQQITLTLSPDSLGELKMNLNLQGQKLSVEIITENKTVRDAIAQHTDALKDSLARQNITMESFDVTTGGKGSGNPGQNQNAWRELAKQQQQQQFWTAPRGYQSAQADLTSGRTAYQKPQGQSMLDIHY